MDFNQPVATPALPDQPLPVAHDETPRRLLGTLVRPSATFAIAFGVLRSLAFVFYFVARFAALRRMFLVGRTVRGMMGIGMDVLFATCAVATLIGGIRLVTRTRHSAAFFRVGGWAAVTYFVCNLYLLVTWVVQVGRLLNREPAVYITYNVSFSVAVHLIPVVLLALVTYRPTRLLLSPDTSAAPPADASFATLPANDSGLHTLQYSSGVHRDLDAADEHRADVFLLRLTACAAIALVAPHLLGFLYDVLIQHRAVAWTRASTFSFEPYRLGSTLRDWSTGCLVAGGGMLLARRPLAARVALVGVVLGAVSHVLLAIPLGLRLGSISPAWLRIIQTWPFFLALAMLAWLLTRDGVRRQLHQWSPAGASEPATQHLS